MLTRPTYFPNLKRRDNYGIYDSHSEYRAEIREDCQRRCVYCDIHEIEAGGQEAMTLDHFRPKDKYKDLECTPKNLLWACHPCNQWKGNDWPALQDANATVFEDTGYIDPFEHCRADFFRLLEDGSLAPLQTPAAYMINVLSLNRPFMVYIRRRRELIYQTLSGYEQYFKSQIADADVVLLDGDLTEANRQYYLEYKQLNEIMLETVYGLEEIFKLT